MKEIVYFVYKDKVYKSAILDFGGARRKYPTLDVFTTPNCKNMPDLIVSKAYASNEFVSTK